MKWTEAVPSQAILHQLKEVEVFTAWPAKSTWMMLASFAFEMISLSLSPRPCKASVLCYDWCW